MFHAAETTREMLRCYHQDECNVLLPAATRLDELLRDVVVDHPDQTLAAALTNTGVFLHAL